MGMYILCMLLGACIGAIAMGIMFLDDVSDAKLKVKQRGECAE